MSSPHFSGSTLVVCPHFDDACFSVGGLLLKKASKKATVLTVFSKSRSSTNSILLRSISKVSKMLKVNFLNGIAVECVSRVRQREDRRFCDSVGAVQCALPFRDSELRGFAKLCLASTDDVDEDSVYKAVVRAIESSVFSESFDYILCPLAIGNHVDHLVVLKAVLQVLKENKDISKKVFLYEDLPYASSYKLDSIDALARNRTGSNAPLFVNITTEMPMKHVLADVYRSQSNSDEKERISYHARRLFMLTNKKVNAEGYCERFWGFNSG